MSDYHSQHSDGGSDDGAGGGRADCGAEELKGLLQRIAAHIADADIRHGTVLQDVHGRLVGLSEDTRAIRETLPSALAASGPHISDRVPEPVEDVGASDQAPSDMDGRYETEEDTGERSSTAPNAAGLSAQTEADWDKASAEALTRIYEVEAVTRSPASGPGLSDFSGQNETDPAVRPHLAESLYEIPAQYAHSPAADHAGSPLAALETRFQAFEHRLGEALDSIATRSDVEGLRLIEAHISELSQHVSQIETQLGRLDAVETQLSRVDEAVSDERLGHLITQASLADSYLERLATALASRLAERRSDEAAGDPGTTKLDQLSTLVEQFVANFRQSEDNTANALGTVQQAMIHLLDRIDLLEPATAPWPSDPDDDDDFSKRSEGEDALARVYHHAASDTKAARPSPAATGQTAELAHIAAEIDEARKAVRSNITASSSDRTSQTDPAVTDSSATGASSSPDREEFIAAARRAARQASGSPESAPANPHAPTITPRAVVGRRRRALGRPLAGLMLATLVVVIAVGVGLTTYSFIKTEPAETAGASASHSSLLLEDDTLIGNATPQQAEGTSGTAEGDSVLINDEPAPGFAQDPSPTSPNSEPPAGIMIETGTLYSTEEAASVEQRRRLAHLSTRLGAAQSEIASIPAALIPGTSGTPVAPSTESSASPKSLPPAAVGPLSLRIAAANGDPSAEFEVAARLAEGRGIEQDFKQAITWYQRSAARGFAPAQYRLGTLYERGLGVKADLGRAKAWYRSAAEKGNIKAMHNLAVLSASSVPSDYKTAAHWFTEAADRGVRDSQFNLAVLLESGIGLKQDLKLAYGWFAVAAQGGDKEAPRRQEQLKHRLLAGEIAAGEAFAGKWRAKSVDPLVNDVRAAGEAWKLRGDSGIAG